MGMFNNRFKPGEGQDWTATSTSDNTFGPNPNNTTTASQGITTAPFTATYEFGQADEEAHAKEVMELHKKIAVLGRYIVKLKKELENDTQELG